MARFPASYTYLMLTVDRCPVKEGSSKIHAFRLRKKST